MSCNTSIWKANNKYRENCNKDCRIPCIGMPTIYKYGICLKKYLKMVLNGKNACKFNRIAFSEKFIKNYDKDNNIGHILKIEVEYLKRLHNFHSDLPLLPEKMKIKKCHKLVCNLYNKNNYVAHIKI